MSEAKFDTSEIRELLIEPKKILILTHTRPDGDALGSSLAWSGFLRKKGHDVDVIVPTRFPKFLAWLPDATNKDIIKRFDTIERNFAKNPMARPLFEKQVKDYEVIFFLDFNDLKRIDGMSEMVAESKAKKVLVDHHIDPAPIADFQYWNVKASSTCELIYELIEDFDGLDLIDADIASSLYTGIVTDTGMFRFPATSKRVHQIAGDLISKGVDIAFVNDRIYNQFTESRLRFVGHCILNKMQVLKEYKTAIITVHKPEIAQFNIQTGDLEGLVNYPLSIDGIIFAILVSEKEGLVKMSLRSKGDFNVQEIATKYFNGGGHKNASGGASTDSIDEVVARFKKILPEYTEKLNSAKVKPQV